MELGKTNILTIVRQTDNGYYLEDKEGNEVLLPNSYILEDMEIEDVVEVFVYKDSEERIIATTIKPFAEANEFAVLTCKQVDGVGAFMDWGLQKDLFVPFAEQPYEMEVGKSYLVWILEDEVTSRLMGSAKENDFLFFDDIDVSEGDEVDLLLYKETELGMNAVVNNLYKGLIFKSDIHRKLTPGEKVKGYVKKVRADGKLDLTLVKLGYKKSIDDITKAILDLARAGDGVITLTDKSTPQEISDALGISKKAYKRGLGALYKSKQLEFNGPYIQLLNEES
jgi:predicted RNA-binding protein (virulence factor B family)